jgi:hypothetical protein
MGETASYPLRLPKSLKKEVAKVAKREGTSINQFIAIAVAEKISALETETFFAERANQANFNAFRTILFRTGGEPPRTGDEISEPD